MKLGPLLWSNQWASSESQAIIKGIPLPRARFFHTCHPCHNLDPWTSLLCLICLTVHLYHFYHFLFLLETSVQQPHIHLVSLDHTHQLPQQVKLLSL